jgi:hypothetical protein
MRSLRRTSNEDGAETDQHTLVTNHARAGAVGPSQPCETGEVLNMLLPGLVSAFMDGAVEASLTITVNPLIKSVMGLEKMVDRDRGSFLNS